MSWGTDRPIPVWRPRPPDPLPTRYKRVIIAFLSGLIFAIVMTAICATYIYSHGFTPNRRLAKYNNAASVAHSGKYTSSSSTKLITITPSPSSNNVLAENNAQLARNEVDTVQATLVSLDDQQERGSLTEQQATVARSAITAECKTALSYSKQAISDDKYNEEAWVQRVAAFYYMADYQGASECLRQAKSIFPESKDFAPLDALIKSGLRKQSVKRSR